MSFSMRSETDDNRPQSCYEVGLNCRDCSAENARELARLCVGLRGKAVSQLFLQVHSHPACAPMHAHFADAYREASARPAPKPMGVATTARAAIAAA